jgi:hypothetical protein
MASKARPTAFINFEIIGNERGVQAMLDSIDSALSPVGLAAFLHGAVGPWVKERAADRFASEGDDVTGRWEPLAETTVEIREGYGFEGAHPINKRTGELEEYITEGAIGITVTPGVGVMKYPENPPSTKSLKTKLSTAQQGRTHPKTVARPVLGLNERDLAQVMTMLAFHVQAQGVLRGARRR